MIPNECIICGGGSSISEGLILGLKDRIKDKFVIVLNYSYKYFNHSLLCFGDKEFYKSTKEDGIYPDIYEELGKLPLIIGMKQFNDERILHPNTILLPTVDHYNRRNNIKNGVYCSFLVGIFALSLAIYLMEGKGTIYLLGYDWTKRNEEQKNNNEKIDTHYYNIKHRGTQWTNGYEVHDPNFYFKSFEKEKEIKIYNVSPNSNINNFEKIDYKKMFEQISTQTFNQDELRKEIKSRL